MIQDLHMLKEKNRNNCIYCSMLSPFVKVDDDHKPISLTNKNENAFSFGVTYKSTPLIKGKKASYSEAIREVKKIIRFEKLIHIDGFSTDLQSIYKIIDFAEKYKTSVNHMCADELNIFFSAFQKYGGSFVSFNELKKRADFVIVIGAKESDFSSYFYRDLNWNKKKIKKTIFYLDDQKVNKNLSFCSNTIDKINYLKSNISKKKLSNDNEFLYLKDKLMKSIFPVVLSNIKKKDYALTYSIFDFVRLVNKKNRIKIFNILGSNNSGGFVNACVTKTGYPNAINFTDIGPIYEPSLVTPDKQKKIKNLQIYISNFESNPNLVFFKKNIFIGHPNFVQKEKVDVFLPSKTPGVDTKGLIVRSDNGGILKLEKKVDSTYPSINELIEDIRKN